MTFPDNHVIPDSNVHTFAVNSVSNYSVSASVFGSWTLFLVDTGAAVSLISSEVWDCIKPTDPPALKPVSLSVDGNPMQVQEYTIVELKISDQVFNKK